MVITFTLVAGSLGWRQQLGVSVSSYSSLSF